MRIALSSINHPLAMGVYPTQDRGQLLTAAEALGLLTTFEADSQLA